MAPKSPFRSALIAPCGMDCAICMAYLREKNRCNGCYAPDRKCSTNCTIFACEHIRHRYYHSCGNYPCRQLKNLDRRYRTKYGMSMLDNLEAIGKHGIRSFLKSERQRWTCNNCGGTINVHRWRCSVCGNERERPGQE